MYQSSVRTERLACSHRSVHCYHFKNCTIEITSKIAAGERHTQTTPWPKVWGPIQVTLEKKTRYQLYIYIYISVIHAYKKVMYRKTNTQLYNLWNAASFFRNPQRQILLDRCGSLSDIASSSAFCSASSTSDLSKPWKLEAMLQVPMVWYSRQRMSYWSRSPWARLKTFISTHLTEICMLVSFPKAWSAGKHFKESVMTPHCKFMSQPTQEKRKNMGRSWQRHVKNTRIINHNHSYQYIQVLQMHLTLAKGRFFHPCVASATGPMHWWQDLCQISWTQIW